jgi:hypothetical protein
VFVINKIRRLKMNTENNKVEAEKIDNGLRNIDKLKLVLKEKAEYIRSQKKEARLLKEKGEGPVASSIHNSLRFRESRDYRCYHIAYCELRGKTRDQIEKPNEFNKPNENKIALIKQEYAWTPEEITTYNERKAKRAKALHTCAA